MKSFHFLTAMMLIAVLSACKATTSTHYEGSLKQLAYALASPPPSQSTLNAVYISQSGTGSGTGLGSCGNAAPVSHFNDSGNWTAGIPTGSQIGPGTAVYLCETIGTTLNFSGSGSLGNPITVACAPGGCDLSQPANGLINIAGQSYIILDGGFPCGSGVNPSTCTGIAENTLNGSGLTNQIATRFVVGASGSGNIEIRNWLIRNLYQHTSLADDSIDQTESNVFYANGITGPFSFHDNTVHDVGWAIEFQNYTNNPLISVYNNYFYNYDHAIAVAAPNSSVVATVNIHDNHFGSTASWDTTANAYHHDGTHFYATTGFNPSWAFYVYNNLFDGSWGSCCNTAQIFTEENPPNMLVFNNVHVYTPGDRLNNGLVNMGTSGASGLFNNTYLGPGTPLALGIMVSGGDFSMQNNVFTGLNQIVNMAGTFTAGSPSNNIYAAYVDGGNTPFAYNGTQLAGFGPWQGATGGDAGPFSQYLPSAGLNSNGILQSGSAAVGAGANLSGLCTGALAALCSTTSAGGTITPVARPSSGAWDIGAFGN